MKLPAALVIVTACGAPSPAHRDPVSPKPVATTTATPTGPTPTSHKERSVIEAPHAGAIVQLTATPDGDVVLTLDELGGVRLWPSLDGTREPKLVELPVARELALGRRGNGFTAVARDEVGGLYIAKLDADGRTLAHTTLGVDPAFAGITMSAVGLIGWRTDHHVLLIDGDGAVTAEIATEPQQRVVDIAVQGSRALALVEVGDKRKARWLTLQPRLGWGAWIDHADQTSLGSALALSPDLAHFAVGSKDDKTSQISIYESDTGKLAASAPASIGEIDLRFVDDNLLAVAAPLRGVQFMVVKDKSPLTPATTQFHPVQQRQLLAVANGKAILARESELMLVTPASTEFLGYQTLTPQLAAAGPDGKLLVISNPSTVMLDTQLRETPTKPVIPLAVGSSATGGSIADLEWIAGDDWLVESSGARNAGMQLAIVDIAKGTSTVVRENLSEVHYLDYEPSTKLASLSFGPQAQVGRVDLKARTLDQVVGTPKRTPYEEFAFLPVSPSLARGTEVVAITVRDTPTFKWLKTTAQDKPTATIAVDGAYLGADAAGHVYAWRATPGGALQVAIYTDGKQTGTLPTKGPASLWPDATGAHVAEAAQGGLTMYRDGRLLWTRQIDGVHEVLWLTDGALAITHAMGIARLDPKTGTVGAARCGWEFGLSKKPHPTSPRIEPICSQLAR